MSTATLQEKLTHNWILVSSPAGGDASLAPNGDTCVVTSTVPGLYTIRDIVSDDRGPQITRDFTVATTQVIASVEVTPATANLVPGATQQFTAVAKDPDGKPITPLAPFTWRLVSGLGTLSNTGLYTAPSGPTTAYIQASANAVGSNMASAVVTPTSATVKITQPAAAALNPGKTAANLTVQATGPDPNRLNYVWSLVSSSQGSGPVIFGTNGTNSSNNSLVTFSAGGGYLIRATVTDPLTGATATSQVTVMVEQVISGLTLLPASVLVPMNASQVITPWARDQFGNNVNPAANGTWWTSGPGTISNRGVYVAPAGAGGIDVLVRFTAANGMSSQATITLDGNAVPGIFIDTINRVAVIKANSYNNTCVIQADFFDPTIIHLDLSGNDSTGAPVVVASQAVPRTQLSRIEFYGQAAYNVTFSNKTELPCTVYGGAGTNGINGGIGNDYLYANMGQSSTLNGQGGDDFLVGGPGINYLNGGTGMNTLVPGTGTNYLRPNS